MLNGYWLVYLKFCFSSSIALKSKTLLVFLLLVSRLHNAFAYVFQFSVYVTDR